MKRTAKILSMVLATVMLVTAFPLSVFAGTTFAGYEEPVANYDDYGYYASYDFENYESGNRHSGYVTSTTVLNADGRKSNPFNMITVGGSDHHASTLKTETLEDGSTNKYLSIVRTGTGDNASLLRFTGLDANGLMLTVGQTTEVGIRLRIHEGLNETEHNVGESALFPIVYVRRGSVGSYGAVAADRDGKIYAYNHQQGGRALVYTPTAEERKEFTDIRFIWFDVSNTYSLYINGTPYVEGMALPTNYRNYVSQTYDSNFMVDTRTAKSNTYTSGNPDYRQIEVCRSANANREKWGFDVDDVVIKAYNTAQDGIMYYENGFDGVLEGASLKDARSEAYFYRSDVNLSLVRESEDNGYLNVSGGFFALNDRAYQQYTQGNFVTEFKVKGKAVHTVADDPATEADESQTLVRKPIVQLIDNHFDYQDTGLNNLYMLYVDQRGNLYLEDNEISRVGGYTLNEDEWLNVAIVAIRNMGNAGKFGPFANNDPNSSGNTTLNLNYYINGQYVGTTDGISYIEWRHNTYTQRTSANQTFTMVNYKVGEVKDNVETPALDLTGLTLVDDTTTANHKIYRNANASVYYDVVFDASGNQEKYSSMTLAASNDRYDTLRFSSENFELSLDDIKVYGGTMPKWFYEAVNSPEGGELFELDFSKVGRIAENPLSLTDVDDQPALGIIKTHNIFKGLSHNQTPGSNNVKLNNGMWYDFVVPTAKDALTRPVIYSFEATLKNITNITASSDKWGISLFTTRFAKAKDTSSGGETLLYVGFGLTSDELTIKGVGNVQLYKADGSRAMLDNVNGNTLRADLKLDPVNKVYTICYFMDGEPLYRADGSVARDMKGNNITSTMKEYYGKINNFRVRALSATGSCNVDIDSIKYSVRAVEEITYVDVADLANAGEVSGISFKLPAFKQENRSGLAALVTLTKGTSASPLVYVDAANGALSVASGNKYYALCNGAGTAFKLSKNGTTDLAVVYNDIDGTARFYVNGKIAYASGEGLNPIVDMPVTAAEFVAATDKIGARLAASLGGQPMKIEDFNIKTVSINDNDTAEIIGFQTNDITGGIRIVAGIDSLYYGAIGFDVEIYENGEPSELKSVMNTAVFDSIVGDGMEITPAKYGYEHFATLNIHSLPKNIPENSYIIARSFVNIAGVKHYDDYVKITVSNDGYSIEDYIMGQTLNMTELMANAKALGRVVEVDSGLAIDHTAAGFAFNFEGMGDVAVNITADKANVVGRLSVTVDGVTKSITVPQGTSTLVIASRLKEGAHEISVINESGIAVPMLVNTVTFNGTLTDAPKATDTYIEFIGDSITAGYGLYPEYVSGAEDHHNGTLSYAYRTTQKLGTDYAIFARSGMAIAFADGGTNTFENRYPYASYVRNTTDPYVPARTPDLVVINLAQNDNYQWYIKGKNEVGEKYNYEILEEKFDGMIETVLELYGKETPILFVYGCMEGTAYEPLVTIYCKNRIETVYTEENGYNITYTVLTTNRGAKDGHPDAEGAEIQATELAAYIKKNYDAFGDTDVFNKRQSVLLIGQSNMVGRGIKDYVEPIEDERILEMNSAGVWEPMVEPVRFIDTGRTNETGIPASFAKAFVETFECELGLIPTAVGGTSIYGWQKGHNSGLYADAVNYAKIAQETSDICAILWHQGESDKGIAPETYVKYFKQLIDDLIKDLGLDKDKIVIVTGEIGGWKEIGEGYKTVNEALNLLDEEGYYANYGVADWEGLTNDPVACAPGSSSHFDSPSLRVLGYRYFEQFYEELMDKECTYEYSQDPLDYRIEPVVDPDRKGYETGDDYINVYFDDIAGESYGSTTYIYGNTVELNLTSGASAIKMAADSAGAHAELTYNKSGDPSIIVRKSAPAGARLEIQLDLLVGDAIKFYKSNDNNFVGNTLVKLLYYPEGATKVTSLHLLGIGGAEGKNGEEAGYYFYDTVDGAEICKVTDFFEWTSIKIDVDLTKGTKTFNIEGTTYGPYNLNANGSSYSTLAVTSVKLAQLMGKADGTIGLDNYKFSYKPAAVGYETGDDYLNVYFDDIAGNSYSATTSIYDGTVDIQGRNYGSSVKSVDMVADANGAHAKITFNKSGDPFIDFKKSADAGAILDIEFDILVGDTVKFYKNNNFVGNTLVKLLYYPEGETKITSLHVLGIGGAEGKSGADAGYYFYNNVDGAKICDVPDYTKWTSVKLEINLTKGTKTFNIGGTTYGPYQLDSSGNTYKSTAVTIIRLAQLAAKADGTIGLDNYKFSYKPATVGYEVGDDYLNVTFDGLEAAEYKAQTNICGESITVYARSATPMNIVANGDGAYAKMTFNKSDDVNLVFNHKADAGAKFTFEYDIMLDKDLKLYSGNTLDKIIYYAPGASSASSLHLLGLGGTSGMSGDEAGYYLYDNVTGTKICDLAHSTWVKIKMEIDLTKGTKTIWVGNTSYGTLNLDASGGTYETLALSGNKIAQMQAKALGVVAIDNYKFAVNK